MLHMEQKSYKLEIVSELLKSENHIRKMARNLGTNHMSIARKINELFKENVVDYRKDGRNKTYFLKKSIEAKSYIFTAENYKLTRVLKKYPNLRRIIERIQKQKDIKLAILFGSYAKSTAKPDSDIDIYIETMNKEIKKDVEMIDTKINVKVGPYEKSSLLIKEIEKNHVIIRGVERYYEKSKFFE